MNRQMLFKILKRQVHAGAINYEPKILKDAIDTYFKQDDKFSSVDFYKVFTKVAFHASNVLGCEVDEIYGTRRKEKPVHGRIFVTWYLYYMLDMPFEDIADEFDKDQSTISANLRSFEEKPENDRFKKIFVRFKKRIDEDPDL